MRSAVFLALVASVATAAVPATVLADRAVEPPSPAFAPLVGTWVGAAWGTVVLHSNGTGSYTDTYEAGPGRIRLRRVADRRYVGMWVESNRRFGTIALTLAADGRTLAGSWTPDPQSTIGSRTGGTLVWTRR